MPSQVTVDGDGERIIFDDGSTLYRDATSITYSGVEGNFSIASDHTITVSFPDGTTCSVDANGSLKSVPGAGSEMRCTADTRYNGVELTVKNSSGERLWEFRSSYSFPKESEEDNYSPEIRRYFPDGSENFA